MTLTPTEVVGLVGTISGWGFGVYKAWRLWLINRRRLAPFLTGNGLFVNGMMYFGDIPDPNVAEGTECVLHVHNQGMDAYDMNLIGPDDWGIRYKDGPGTLGVGSKMEIHYPKRKDLDGRPIQFRIQFEVEGVRGEHTYEHQHYCVDLRRVKPKTWRG
jgi:hypothetical protein